MSCQTVELKHVAPPMEEELKGELAILVVGPEEELRKTISKCRDSMFN
jgi:hypothetical protein